MKWCNLYLTESKYRLQIKHSTLVHQLSYYCFSLLVLSLVSVCIEPQSIERQYFLVLSVFFSISIFIVGQTIQQNYILTVDSTGQVALNEQPALIITRGSRIGWIGCWLHLGTPTSHQSSSVRLFIFKDSVSKHDYARLCRSIIRFQRHSYQDEVL